MDEYDITFMLLDKEFTMRVKAKTLDAAWKKVASMRVLDLLKDKTLDDFGCVFSGSYVEK